MKKNMLSAIYIAGAVLMTTVLPAAITGTTFRDYNNDGIQQAGEFGEGGIAITAYPDDGSASATTTSGADGSYTLNVSTPARLEFTLPTNATNCGTLKKGIDFPAAGSNGSSTNVQFAKADGEVHNFAFAYPGSFSTNPDPWVFTSVTALGDPLSADNANLPDHNRSDNAPGIVKFHFNAEHTAPNSGRGVNDGGEAWIELVKYKQVGSTKGLAYSRQANKIFAAAFLKRHSGFGPGGSGAIYMIDPDQNASVQTGNVKFVSLDDLGFPTQASGAYDPAVNTYTSVTGMPDVIGSNSDRAIPADIFATEFAPHSGNHLTNPYSADHTNDSAAFGQVGRLSLGDIDISDDGQYLFVVNLYDRKLYKIDLTDPANPTVPDASKVTSYQIPDKCSDINGTGEYRPFGLKVTRGKAFVGVVCSGQDSSGSVVASDNSDVAGYVVSLDTATLGGTKLETSFNFHYRDGDDDNYDNWNAWTNGLPNSNSWYHPMPIISDIEFSNSGNMLIAITDIWGDKVAYPGPVLKQLSDSDDRLFQFHAQTKGDLLKAPLSSSCTYATHLADDYNDTLKHNESSSGMLAGHHTSETDSVLSTFMDPVNNSSSGVMLYNNVDGSQVHSGYEIVQTNSTNTGKANGLGDIEAMEIVPPIEVGNLVWEDTDNDGIQDAGESGIANVNVELLDSNGDVNATTTTDANGNYFFGANNVNNGAGLLPHTTYSIRIADSDFTANKGVAGTALDGYILTVANATSNGQSDWSDSDAPQNAGTAETPQFTTGDAGDNNYTLDFGFFKPVPVVDIEKSTNDEDADVAPGPLLHVGDAVSWKYVVVNKGNEALKNIVVTDDKNVTVDCNGKTTLAVDENMTCIGSGTATLGAYENNGTVTAVGATSGNTVTDSDLSHYTVPVVSVGSVVWNDLNRNGIQDAGEPGIAGVKVTLLDTSGNPVAGVDTNTTGTDGQYFFGNLPEGNYKIKVDMSGTTGYVKTDNQVADPNNDVDNDTNIKDVAGDIYTSGVITLSNNGEPTEANGLAGTDNADDTDDDNGNMTVDFGFFKPVPVVDIEKSTNDEDADVAPGPLLHVGDAVTWTYVVVNKGNEALKNIVVTDDKNVTVDCNGKTTLAVDENMTCTGSGTATLGAYENNGTVTAVGVSSGKTATDSDLSHYTVPAVGIGSLVWEDTNNNGIQDAGESPIKGAVVKLLNASGVAVAGVPSQTTGADGLYYFSGLPEGSYIVEVTPPAGYVKASIQNANADDNVDNDSNIESNVSNTYRSGVVALANNDEPTEANGLAGTDDADNADEDNGNMTVDFGFVKLASIGDYVWEDTNANGIQETGESGVAGAKVELLDATGTVVKTFTTLTNGKYEFKDLIPGDYKVRVTPPSGYAVSKQDANGDATDADGNNTNEDSDIATDTNTTITVNLSSGESDKTWDAGVFKPACIGNRVWEDKNANGIQEPGESGIKDINVTIYDANGVVATDAYGKPYTSTIPTDATGKYEFCDLTPGDYHVKVTVPAEYVVSPKDATGKATDADDVDRDSDINAQGETVDATLLSGENDSRWDAGLFKPACLGDYTWLDKNVNGIQDAGDEPLDKVTVTLLDANDSAVTTGAYGQNITPKDTNGTGGYEFCGLIPGTYKVEFKKAHDANGAPFISTAQDRGGDDTKDSDIQEFKDVENGLKTPAITLESGDNNRTLDAGFIQEICLGDYVWEDMNANGIKDSGEPALANVSVSLMMKDANGAWVQATDVKGYNVDENQTDVNGNYKFCHLKPAIDYKIVFAKPTGYYVTDKDANNNSKDANDSDIDENSEIVVNKPVKDDMTLDAGYFKPACIGDYVWLDKNANGIQEVGENGLDGVQVELLQNGSTTIKDVDKNDIATLVTANGGKYHFGKVGNECKLKPGKYSLRFTTPDGYYFTRKDTTNDSNDSDVQEQFAHKVGTTLETELTSGEDDTTWDAGVFKPACIGNYIWDDKNANGVQDTDEQTLKDDNGNTIPVQITLLPKVDAFGNSNSAYVNGNTITPQDTNTTGGYKFCQLVPGDYQVKVTVPTDYVVTRDNAGSDSNDSDMGKFLDTGDVTMPKETLSSGEDNNTFDGGVFKPSCLGSTIWFDKNADGVKDTNEEGIADVNVTLIPVEDEFGNENNQTAYKEPYKMITTQNDGKYEFCNLIPGKYRVKFVAPLKDGAPLITTKKNAGNDTKDSDTPEYEQGAVYSDVVTLGSRENNPTVFAGYIQKICLGDKVWFDENLNGIQDKTEPGVTDVNVHLTYPNGTIVKDVYGNIVKLTKTDKKGNYQFCDLFPARDYKIKFDMPEGYRPTLKDKGTDDKDSDANREVIIDVMKPTVDNFKQDLGIYCECDDYKVHPEEHKKLGAPALNVLGLLAMVTAVFVLVRRED